MSVGQFMTNPVITLNLDDDLSKAKKVFDQERIHHLIIVDGERISGIVTDRDLYKHLSPSIGTKKETPRDTSLLQKKLHLIMCRDLITASPNISLNDAVLLFFDNHISCLPIVDEFGRPIGILSWRDIIKVLALKHRRKLQQK